MLAQKNHKQVILFWQTQSKNPRNRETMTENPKAKPVSYISITRDNAGNYQKPYFFLFFSYATKSLHFFANSKKRFSVPKFPATLLATLPATHLAI
jgi:hypothetical protein